VIDFLRLKKAAFEDMHNILTSPLQIKFFKFQIVKFHPVLNDFNNLSKFCL
jgi:hypothetical protein